MCRQTIYVGRKNWEKSSTYVKIKWGTIKILKAPAYYDDVQQKREKTCTVHNVHTYYVHCDKKKHVVDTYIRNKKQVVRSGGWEGDPVEPPPGGGRNVHVRNFICMYYLLRSKTVGNTVYYIRSFCVVARKEGTTHEFRLTYVTHFPKYIFAYYHIPSQIL